MYPLHLQSDFLSTSGDRGRPNYNEMVDMWAFGCTFYEVMHLKPMFSGQFLTLVNDIADIRLSEFEANCPENFKNSIMQCFDARPDNRPDALQFMEAAEGVKFKLQQSSTSQL